MKNKEHYIIGKITQLNNTKLVKMNAEERYISENIDKYIEWYKNKYNSKEISVIFCGCIIGATVLSQMIEAAGKDIEIGKSGKLDPIFIWSSRGNGLIMPVQIKDENEFNSQYNKLRDILTEFKKENV